MQFVFIEVFHVQALEYLNQRESQISNILESYTREGGETTEAAGKDPPDKKLKTSEGRPDPAVQSPPATSKTSTDSESDAGSSSDSIIQKFRKSSAQPTAGAQEETAALPESERRPRGRTDVGADIVATADPFSPGVKAADSGVQSAAGGGTADLRRLGRRSGGWTPVEGDATAGGQHKLVGAPTVVAEQRLLQQQPAAGDHASPAAAGKQLQQSTPSPSAAVAALTATPKRSIFSPDRTTVAGNSIDATPFGGRNIAAGQKENESPVSSWRSPRDGKPADGRSPRAVAAGRDKSGGARDPLPLGPAKSPAQSPALSRSFESGLPRGSPQLTNRSPAVAVAQSPMKSSPHQPPLVSRDTSDAGLLLLPPALNKSDNEPEELPSSGDISRKYSVESKDSDADSAKSSLLDANDTMRDFGKDDEDEEEEEEMVRESSTTTTTAIGNNNKVFDSSIEEGLSLARQQQQQQQSHLIHQGVQQQQAKMDEGYVSAEKVHPADPIIAQSLALLKQRPPPNVLGNSSSQLF